ncbi:MAG: HEAT repeat domain-containing protein [Bacteroidetes bacterium]|jgi:hypothetical protein|nr:HEAT repeat domain-containing protein [Bacteroidota bacterium]
MNTERIEQLLDKYFDGETSLEEEKKLREFFRQEDIPTHLKSYADQFSYTEAMVTSKTDIDPFAKIEEQEKEKSPFEGRKSSASAGLRGMTTRSSFITWTLRAAAAIILVLTGLTAGLLINQQDSASDEQLAALQQEISQMKNSLMYGSVGQASASERISAVYSSSRLQQGNPQLDSEITDILIYTMNNDQNVNVRLAAAEALYKFRHEPRIGKALTNSLSKQNDPLMQITLIEMLVEMKQKSAVNEMQKMLLRTETQDVVKQRLESSIAELKV